MLSSRVAADVMKLLPRKRLSGAMGNLAGWRVPQSVLDVAISGYCRVFGVDMTEYSVPAQGFESFDAFFTRSLKPGSRSVDERQEVVISPADGRVEDLGSVTETASFLVKGQRYSAGELLGDEPAAARFRGGSFFIVYLSPANYHRVHAPVGGEVSELLHVGGTLYPVNAIGLDHVPLLFARNERVVTWQHNPLWGRVATVMVGAFGVGRISMSYEPRVMTNAGKALSRHIRYESDAPRLEKGDELGIFHLGSTAIVFVEPQPGGARFELEAGARALMGQGVLRREAV